MSISNAKVKREILKKIVDIYLNDWFPHEYNVKEVTIGGVVNKYKSNKI